MTRAKRLRAVVFDLDGTLIDSLPLVLASVGHALDPFGSRSAEEIFARLGGPPERFLETLLDDVQNVPVAMDRLDAFHQANAHLIQPYTGVTAVLTKLRDAGVQVALWTGRDRASTAPLLREHQLADFFAAIVCGDDLPSHKPDSAGLREIMRRLGVTPNETLFVGDADVDVLGGVECGVDTLLVRHSRAVELPIASKSWLTVTSPADAFAVVLD